MQDSAAPQKILPLRIRIAGIGAYVPERRVTNEEISWKTGSDPAWPLRRLGIRERRVAAEDQRTSGLAALAGTQALAASDIAPADIGMVVLATMTPDRQVPSTACRVGQLLGTNDAPAFDISAACSGFVYALLTAAHSIQAGFRDTALVIGADTMSSLTDWSSRDCVYFGDGAGAVVLQRSKGSEAFLMGELAAAPEGYEHFTVPPGQTHFSMNGRCVYESAHQLITRLTRETLAKAGIAPHEIDHVLPHQPSVHLLKSVADEVGISFNKFWLNMDRYANTAAATVPIALHEAHSAGALKPGDWTLLAAAGAGMTSGVALYRWH